MVASVHWNEQIHSAVGIRGARLARRLGLITYPLYLLHQVAGYALLKILKGHVADLTAFFVVVALMLLLATCISIFLEDPMQRWLRHRLLHAKAPAQPATSVP